MKKNITTALAMLPLLAMAQTNTYTLQGKFKSASVAGKVYMQYYKGGITKRDSATVSKGAFELKGPLDGPQQVYLTFFSKDAPADKRMRNQDARSMYLDRGLIRMDISDSIKTASLSGTINADHKKYEQVLKTKEGQEARLTAFVKQNPDSYFSLQALLKLAGAYFDAAKVEPLFKGLSAGNRNSKEGQAFAATIAASKATVAGNMAPDFTHNDTNGKPVKLSDFKGKYVLLDFWASWCGPCRAENPKVLKAYNAFKDKNFTVLGVSVDRAEDRDKWLKAIKDDGMPWTQLNDADHTDLKGAGNLYAIKAIPSNFLIDPSGKIIAKNLRGDALEKKLEEMIK
ncbi:TlpA disulfide reductase family protein [Pedobacter africanus]|uniref:Peroxiredoxin n=1 Tax=Pedobacter africanus TaxID=151894 RepID=A0A1W2DHA1_9SPHI|nr:TlpA disulfide reductase family protein [Pedobacter africanus]SMC96815.1 Peroxiredoxin [Pedobacter africanus]